MCAAKGAAQQVAVAQREAAPIPTLRRRGKDSSSIPAAVPQGHRSRRVPLGEGPRGCLAVLGAGGHPSSSGCEQRGLRQGQAAHPLRGHGSSESGDTPGPRCPQALATFGAHTRPPHIPWGATGGVARLRAGIARAAGRCLLLPSPESLQ